MSARRSAALVIAAAAVLAALVALAYGAADGAVTFVLLGVLGGASLTAAHRLAARRGRLGSLRRQFVLGVALAVGQLAIAIMAGAWLMFVSAHDAIVVAVLAVFAGLVAARAAQLLAAGVMDDIEALGATLQRLAMVRASLPPRPDPTTSWPRSRRPPTSRSPSSTAPSAPSATSSRPSRTTSAPRSRP